jgi:adenylylsulfate kinase-like enzyme
MVEQQGQFIEVFVDASVDECARRDVKGLYEKAFRGEIKEFTGVSDPYEAPEFAEIRIESEHEGPDESAQRILELLEQRGLIPAAVTV